MEQTLRSADEDSATVGEDVSTAVSTDQKAVGEPEEASADADDDKLRKLLKHREYVKRSYRKKITTIQTLKGELEALERHYNELLAGRKSPSVSPSTHVVVQDDGNQGSPPLLRRYVQLAHLKAQLQAENSALYELNAERMKAESRLQQLLDTELEFPNKQSQLPRASLPAQPRFHFTSLSDAEYSKIIATARDDILKFAYDTEKLSSGSRVFGWTDQRKIVGDELKFALEKEFPTVSAHDLQARSWPIFSTPERFSKIYSSSLNLRFQALQRINEDTHLFYRTVHVEGSDSVAKTVFLLARIRIDGGYMVIFRAIDPASVAFREDKSNHALDEMHALQTTGRLLPPRREIWVDKYSWVIFQEHGPDSCLFHFGGSTLSNLWLKEVLFIALRWEALTVGPPIMLET